MIKSITHKGLKQLWYKNDPSKLPAAQIDKIKRVLTLLDTTKKVDAFHVLPGYKLHQLSGDLSGMYSVTITGNYRKIFEFREENAYLVDYLDYH